VANVDVPQSGQGIQIALAVGIDNLGAFAADDNERLRVVGGVIQRMDQVITVGMDDLVNVDAWSR
jgi:pantothenate kinase-related protein Tda10